MIVEGRGLLATAFVEWGDPTIPAIVFARGVSDSSCTDERAYERELTLLREATERSRAVGPIVYFAGAPIYSDFAEPVREDASIRPSTRYGRHQADAEALIRASGVPFLCLRLPNVVGPGGHPHQLVPSLVHQVLFGEVTLQESASRDLLDLADVVALTQRLIEAGVRDEVVNVASGISTSARDIVSEITRILDVDPEIERVAGGTRQRFDVLKLRRLIGQEPFPDSYPVDTLRRWVPRIAAGAR